MSEDIQEPGLAIEKTMENGSLLWDLIELAGHLRQERLFVLSEQTHLQELNEKVVTASSELAQVAWVTAQQRVNLNRLILSCPDATPATCCRRARALESTHFVDAHKILGYQNCSSYGELLQTLRDSPRLLAHCLLAGDRLIPDEMPGVVQSLIAGLYASCVLPQDKSIVLQVLSHLITLQLLPSEYPRRLLRQGSCAFSRLYSSFHEGLFSGKLFLTAALHSPILQLLMLEEKHLDIDPEKAIMRLSHDEKLRRFGVEGSEEYKLEVERHKRWTISNLVAITKNFISSLHDNLHCFPSAVCWLVGQIYARLTNSNKLQEREVFCMCTDVVFTMFVCPAIVTPEPYGIMDAPISAVARFNLIQVAQILQMLAMLKYQQVDPKVKDLYSQFDKDCVSSIIDSMIEGSIISDNPQVGDNMNLQGLCRSAALFTEAELHSLVSFLRTVANEANSEDTKLQKELAKLLRQIPEQIVNGHSKPNVSPDVPQKKHNILSKGKARAHNGNAFETSAEEEDVVGEKVLVIPFNTNTKPFVGLDSEQKILAMEKDANRTTQGAETDRQERAEGQEKRTRFSLSHDDGSIGNTSDNLEVVSEAPSNHSVASSLELETEDQNDNLSDMVSANVSGRGSPNISGRETPSSQITEGDEIGQVGTSTRQQLDFNPPPPPNKHSRFDIDEKFGKFEIKTLIEGADETVSLVSDTWSTDVLASDSETIEQPLLQAQLSLPDHQQLSGPQLMDVSETASEAWSTDVVASDSERLTEVDTDDTASVARSDDTGRSEVESRGDPEAVEDPQSGQATVSSVVSFRSIREEVRGSPTRVDNFGQQSSGINVAIRTGAKTDYRKKTLEYVDGNRNIYSKPVPDEQCSGTRAIHILEKPPDVKPALVSTTQGIVSSLTSSPTHASPSLVLATGVSSGVGSGSAADASIPQIATTSSTAPPQIPSPLHNSTPNASSLLGPVVTPTPPPRLQMRSASQQLTSQEMSTEDDRVEGGVASGCFSTASVASSTSSGSSLETRSTNPELIPSTPLVMQNGSVVIESSSPLPKPSASTGAIPKSISFDKTAERGDKESLDEDGKHKKSFFRNFKLPFKNRRGKSLRGAECYDSALTGGGSDMEGFTSLRLRRGLSDDRPTRHDTSDDILAKYRRKPTANDEENKTKQNNVQGDIHRPVEVSRLLTTYPFDDVKKKLRLVLSTAEIQQIPDTLPAMRKAWVRKENELVAFLQLQLAEAINLQDRSLIPHLHETLRCLKMFSERECCNLLESLKEDYKSRSPYVSYLVKCRQSLLSTSAHLERLLERVKCDRCVVLEFLTAACVRIFLERRESQLAKFCSEFQSLTLADEKNDLLDSFLHVLILDLERDPIWHSASEAQINQARTAVERSVFSRVYLNAMYPNGEGDISRDQVLQEHMAKLAKVVTPNHKDLRIPKMFHHECPWLSAQAEVDKMAAYRTPKDKLQCVLRCTTTIMNLLSLACVPAADDLMPVLVYVVIMANPPSLLSTLEYVSCFYGNRLEGEEQYYWTQFCSAIEFIKTMDYIVCE